MKLATETRAFLVTVSAVAVAFTLLEGLIIRPLVFGHGLNLAGAIGAAIGLVGIAALFRWVAKTMGRNDASAARWGYIAAFVFVLGNAAPYALELEKM